MSLSPLPGRRTARALFVTSLIITVFYNSLWRVPQGHRGVVLQFGAIRPEPLKPGLHLLPPRPMSEVRLVPVDPVRQVRVEERLDQADGGSASEFMTGDENLINVALRVDYRVADPLEIGRSGLDRAERLLERVAESSLVQTLAQKSVTDLLGPGREAIGLDLRRLIQEQADRQGLGLSITGVIWSQVNPPREVQADFEKAQSAVNEAARTVAEATTGAEAISLQTLGDLEILKAETATKFDSLKIAAVAESKRFETLLKQARRTGFMPTAKTLWLDTVSQIMPKLRGRTVLATEQPLDLTIIRQPHPDQPPKSK